MDTGATANGSGPLECLSGEASLRQSWQLKSPWRYDVVTTFSGGREFLVRDGVELSPPTRTTGQQRSMSLISCLGLALKAARKKQTGQ